MVWLPALWVIEQWLSSSFTTLFLKLEGHLGECVCLMLKSFGGETRQTNSEFPCAHVLMCLILVLNQLGEEKGIILTLSQAWISWPKPWTSAISNSLLLLMKEGYFFLLSSLSCWWLCSPSLHPCTSSGTWALLEVDLTHQSGRITCWVYFLLF